MSLRHVLSLATLFHCASAHASLIPFPPDPVVFDAVSTPATGICPEPCFDVRIFLQAPSRSIDLRAIQLDIDVAVGARVATQPILPATNSNARAGNAYFFSEEDSRPLPWDLSYGVGASLTSGYDVLLVEAASIPLTIASLDSLRSGFDGCTPRRDCEIFEDALARNRFYLGAFRVTRDGDPGTLGFEVRIGNVTGIGSLMQEVQLAHAFPRYAFVPYPVPEPADAALLALGAALGARRMRLRPVRLSPAARAAPS